MQTLKGIKTLEEFFKIYEELKQQGKEIRGKAGRTKGYKISDPRQLSYQVTEAKTGDIKTIYISNALSYVYVDDNNNFFSSGQCDIKNVSRHLTIA